MSEKIHVLAQQVFGKPSVEACDLEEIKALVNRYPYFAPGQFLLLQKLKSLNDPGYGAQLQKSVLYYHNPLAFEYFINSERFITEIDLNQSAPVMNTEESHPETNKTFQEASVAQPEAEYNLETSGTEIESNKLTSEQVLTDNLPAPEADIEENIIEAGADRKEWDGTESEALPDQSFTENEALPAEDLESQAPAAEIPMAENEALPDLADNSTSDHHQPPKEAAVPLAFEPFHTVDYFASQGIKLSQEEISKDKFGKQLKSFTEWLKTMKRIPAQEAGIDASTEKKLEHLAEDSVHNPDVVTETMAEVWLKQGNTQKAIETYNKLSLLNPSKKAYFAGLIENLKRS